LLFEQLAQGLPQARNSAVRFVHGGLDGGHDGRGLIAGRFGSDAADEADHRSPEGFACQRSAAPLDVWCAVRGNDGAKGSGENCRKLRACSQGDTRAGHRAAGFV
jgi:hypothetical protein